MSNNHLIIGLGGTGGRIIQAFRKTIYQEHRNREPRLWDEVTQSWLPPSARIGYLYVDSNGDDLQGNDADWKVLGQSVKLDPDSLLLISDADVRTVLENSVRSPGIAPWIGDSEILQQMTGNASGAKGANQIRRFGRFLFASKVSEFNRQINKAISKLIEGGTSDVTFHVCCTLAAGTGSGSLIDAISQIRRAFSDRRLYKVLIYALVTEKDVEANTGNFHANQYAALSELNALILGKFQPHDISAVTPGRLPVRDNFEQCFLITSENEQNGTATRKEQEEMVADYLYQKIVALRGNVPDQLKKAESFEDLTAYSDDKDGRSNQFGSLGVKRFAIPEVEIREKLAFTFAEQASLQFQFNNWTDAGFVRSATTRDLPEFVTKPANNERWYLTDEHLKLSTDFRLVGGDVWAKLREDWENNIAHEKQDIFETHPRAKEQWLPLLREFANEHYSTHYRSRGVVTYYEDKRRAKTEYAREIRNKVEADLFSRWKTGEDSVNDTLRILDALLDYLKQRKQKLDSELASERRNDEDAADRVAENERQWNRIGWLTDLFTNKPEKIFSAYADALRDMYIARTEAVAIEFAKELIQQVTTELTELRTHVDKVSSVVADASERYTKEIACRCAREEHVNFRDRLVRFIEPTVIDRTIGRLATDRRVQEAQTQAARDGLCKLLGTEQTFTAFAKTIPVMRFMDTLSSACDEAASTAHESLFKSPSADFRRILGVNIIEKLYEHHGGFTDRLQDQIRTLVQSAAAYMTFDGQQTQPAVQLRDPMIPHMPRGSITVFLPKCQEHEQDFRQQVKKAFQSAIGGGLTVEVVDSDHNPNEITIISARYWFALRFMRPLARLGKLYEDAVRANQDRTVHAIHLENHRCEIDRLPSGRFAQLPSLYLPDDKKIREKALPIMLLAYGMDLIRPMKDEESGIETLYFAERNAAGRAITAPVNLGSLDLGDLIERIQPDQLELIDSKVRTRLGDGYKHVEKKDELRSFLETYLDEVYARRGQNDLDKVYRRFLTATEDAKQLLN